MPEPDATAQPEVRGLGMVGALVAVSTWGAASVIPKEVDMGGLAVATYRFGTYGLVVAALMAARRRRIGWKVMRASMWGGLALGLDVAFFFSAIKLTTVANATVIGALQPVVVAIGANRVFGEVIRPRDIALGGVAIAGVTVSVLAVAADAPTAAPGAASTDVKQSISTRLAYQEKTSSRDMSKMNEQKRAQAERLRRAEECGLVVVGAAERVGLGAQQEVEERQVAPRAKPPGEGQPGREERRDEEDELARHCCH